jgi:hypothetical protein
MMVTLSEIVGGRFKNLAGLKKRAKKVLQQKANHHRNMEKIEAP